MPSDWGPYWLVTWSLWAAVVFLDRRREPRDWRWAVSLGALILVAAATRESLREFNLRFVLLAGLAAVVILSWGVGRLLSRRRLARTAAWAREHGFEAVALASRRTEDALPDDLRRLPIFAGGSLPRTEGVVAREDGEGGTVLAFRHAIRRKMAWYGASGVEVRGTVVALRRPGMWLPLFQVRPSGLLSWIDGGPIGEAVPVAGASRFAGGYRLGGHEPTNLRALFSDALLDAIAEKPGWIIQGEGEWIAASYFDRSENLMSLKTSSLRTARLDGLGGFVKDSGDLLGLVADRASRWSARDLGAA